MHNFSVSQNDWYGDTTPQIVPISSAFKSIVLNSTSTSNGNATSSHKMPAGSIAGIGVGAAFFFLIPGAIAAAVYSIRRRRRRREEQSNDPKIEETLDPYAKPEMDGSGKDPLAELKVPWRSPAEADSCSRIEMAGNGNGTELVGSRVSVEMEGSHLAGEERLAPVEMDAGTHGVSEAPSSSPRTLRNETSSSPNNRRERPTGRRKPLPKQSTFDREED